jgi:hypothetical protein
LGRATTRTTATIRRRREEQEEQEEEEEEEEQEQEEQEQEQEEQEEQGDLPHHLPICHRDAGPWLVVRGRSLLRGRRGSGRPAIGHSSVPLAK